MDSIEAALADQKLQENPSYTTTAKMYGFDRTTLSRQRKGVTMRMRHNSISNALLSSEQKNTLIAFVDHLTKRRLPQYHV